MPTPSLHPGLGLDQRLPLDSGQGLHLAASVSTSPHNFFVALAHAGVAHGELALAPGQGTAEPDFLYSTGFSPLKWYYSKKECNQSLHFKS